MSERIEKPRADHDDGQHDGSRENGIGGDDDRAVSLHQLFAKQNPGCRYEKRKDNHEVAGEGGFAMGARGVGAADSDEGGAGGRGKQSGPAEEIEALFGEERGGGGQKDGHGANHERSVADGGAGETVELDQKLEGYAEHGGGKEHAQLAALKADTIEKSDRQDAHACEKKAVKDHVLDAHLIEREASPIEPGTPKGASESASAIAEPGEAAGCRKRFHLLFTVAYARRGGITARNGRHGREYCCMSNGFAKARQWLGAGIGLTLVAFAIGAQARAQLPAAPAPGEMEAVEEARQLPQKAAARSSQPPAFTIPIEPLGFTAPSNFYVGLRYSLASLDFIDEDRLLFTFRVPGLLRRGPAETRDDERQIRAVVLALPQGNVLAEALWTIHGKTRYLWMLKDGHFLLRDGDLLRQGDISLELKPLLRFPGPVTWLELDPTEQFLVTDSIEPDPGAKPGMPGPPAGDANQGSGQQSTDDAAADITVDGETGEMRKDMVVRILRRENGKVMLVSRTRTAVHLPINGEGYVESVPGTGGQWQLSLDYFAGGETVLGRVESTCAPNLDFIAPRVVLASTCDHAGGRRMVAMRTDGLHLWQEANSSVQVWPILVKSPSGTRIARESLAVNHVVSTTVPIEANDIKGQRVEVFEAATGKVALTTSADPILDVGGNVAISPSGRRVAVINAGAIQVFELAQPRALP